MSAERDRTDGDDAPSGNATGRSLNQRVRAVWRIARWESRRTTGTVDARTALVVVCLLIVVGLAGLSVADRGVGLEDDIYTVGLTEDSPYEPVVATDSRLTAEVTDFDTFYAGRSDANLFVADDGELTYGTNAVDEAAAAAFADAVDAYNDRRMAAEPDEQAAFPVFVTITYEQRTAFDETAPGDDPVPGADDTSPGEADDAGDDWANGGTDDAATGADDGIVDTGDDASDRGPGEADDGAHDAPGETDGAPSDVDDADDGVHDAPGETDDGTVAEESTDDGLFGIPGLGDSGASGPDGRPSSLSPPFPFESLILAFLFIVPMNFVIQAYGSTIMDERLNRRGELLLVAPVSRQEIVAGKTLPYFLTLTAIVAGIAAAIGGGVLSVAATVPVALLFLAATFVGAMFARSFKELTFVTVTISVVLTTYAFVPAIFTEVTPIALISPLTLVVMDLQGSSVSPLAYLFSTGPFYASAAVFFVLGMGLYREEDMFAQKPIPAKALDALATRVQRLWHVPVVSILVIPFVFAAQLVAVALLFAIPEAVALPLLFVLAAAIEELAKSLHLYAGFANDRFEETTQTAVLVGTLSGIGFFLGEKVTHVVQLVGLSELPVAQAAFGPALSAHPAVLLGAVFAPLVVHVVTTVIAATGASRGRHWYAFGLGLATVLHAAYNIGVVVLVG